MKEKIMLIDYITNILKTTPIENAFVDFLYGIKDKNIKEKVNNSLIRLYKFLITTEKYNSVCFETISFPIIVRVVSKTCVELQDPEAFCEYCYNWIVSHEGHFKKMKERGVKIDVEAQMCAELADTIVKTINEI